MGNWKMNGSRESSKALCAAIMAGLTENDKNIVVCVPAVYLAELEVLTRNSPLALGAQNVADQESGAYTGEIAASMLKEVGCKYVLVGHSERRTYYGDSDESVAARFCFWSNLFIFHCSSRTLYISRRESKSVNPDTGPYRTVINRT
jgi:triosephosphate isomerase